MNTNKINIENRKSQIIFDAVSYSYLCVVSSVFLLSNICCKCVLFIVEAVVVAVVIVVVGVVVVVGFVVVVVVLGIVVGVVEVVVGVVVVVAVGVVVLVEFVNTTTSISQNFPSNPCVQLQ